MKNNRRDTALKKMMATLAFFSIAGLLTAILVTAVGAPVMANINMAVYQGAPLNEYTENCEQPSGGTLLRNDTIFPSIGAQYGSIICSRIGLDAPLFYGDSENILSKGAGQYVGSALPGEKGVVLLGGHDLGYFAPLEIIEKNDIIKLTTTYGKFVYEVTGTEVKPASSYSRSELSSDVEELILYTCYPFGAVISDSEERFFVVARKISGPEFME